MRETLRRWLLLPALLSYCALLLTAALPGEVTPPVAEPLTAAARAVFAAAQVRPFAFVFGGPRGDVKRGRLVISAHAQRADGTMERVFAAPAARLRGYRWVQPAEETLVMKTLVLSAANRLMSTRSARGRRKLLSRLRSDRRLAGLARFACRSQHAAAGRAERVWLTLHAEGVSYRTGRRYRQTRTIRIHDCATGRSLSPSPWPAAALDRRRLPYPLPGKPDPLWSPAENTIEAKAQRARAPGAEARPRVMFEGARAPLGPLVPWRRPEPKVRRQPAEGAR